MNNLYSEIISNIQKVKIDFIKQLRRNLIPNTPGWYFIETTAPSSVLLSTNQPIRPGLNYDIPSRINFANSIAGSGLIINQSTNLPYIAYSGETGNLKARAREHISGHKNTACLALGNYSNLTQHDWYFLFVSSLSSSNFQISNKMIRIFGEQIWRSKNGWPILSKG